MTIKTKKLSIIISLILQLCKIMAKSLQIWSFGHGWETFSLVLGPCLLFRYFDQFLLSMQAVTGPHVHFVVNFPAANIQEFFKSYPVLFSVNLYKVGQGGKCWDIGPMADGEQFGPTTLQSFLQLSSDRYSQGLTSAIG